MATDSPYSCPTEVDTSESGSNVEKKKKFWSHAIWISAALSTIPPILGTVLMVMSMRKTFDSLGNAGIGDPAALSAYIAEVVIATMTGLIISIPAMIFMIIAIVRVISCQRKLGQLPA
jgi:biopolymer transport protein ExbB/TolQ